jgi:sugar diacid utilization regulator
MKQTAARTDSEVNALATIASELLGLTDDVDSILTLITRKTRQFLDSDTSHIILFDKKSNELYVKAHSGIITEEFKRLRAPAGEGLAGWVFREKKPVICTDYAADPRRSLFFLDGVEKEGLRQLLGVPLFVDGEVGGVLFSCNRSPLATFSAKHVELASAFANLASVALQNARLYSEQRKTLAKLKVLNEQLSDSNQLLRQAGAIHEQFIMMELRGGGAATIASTLTELISNPVVVEDRHGELLAISGYNRYTDSKLKKDIISISIYNLAKVNPWIKEKLKLLTKEKQHLWISRTDKANPIKRRLVIPILVGHELLGYISGLEVGRKLGNLDIVATQYAALVLALDMMKQKAVFEAEQRAKGDLLSSLLSGDYDSEEQLLKRASYLGYDLTGPRRAMVVRIDNLPYSEATPTSDENGRGIILDQLLHAIHRSLSSVSPQSIAVMQNDEIVVLAVCEDSHEEFSAGSIAGRLASAIKQAPKQIARELTASVGIGCVCLKLEDYGKSYSEARKALDLAKWAGKRDEIVPLGALGIYGLLFEPHNYKKLLDFSQEILDPLVRHDQKHTSSLVKTLSTFFNSNCSPKETVSYLSIHKNTLRQRLERIQELCKVNLRDADDKFALQLALKVRELKNST